MADWVDIELREGKARINRNRVRAIVEDESGTLRLFLDGTAGLEIQEEAVVKITGRPWRDPT